MSKNLLKEHEIRRMMKFANLEPLTETFIDNLEEQDDEMPEEGGDDLCGPPEDELGDEPEAPDAGGEGVPGGAGDVDVEQLATDIAAAIEKNTGVEVSVEGDEEGGEPEMDAEPEMGGD